MPLFRCTVTRRSFYFKLRVSEAAAGSDTQCGGPPPRGGEAAPVFAFLVAKFLRQKHRACVEGFYQDDEEDTSTVVATLTPATILSRHILRSDLAAARREF